MKVIKTINLSEDNLKEILQAYFKIPKSQINFKTETLEVGSEISPLKQTIISAELKYDSDFNL